MKRLVVIFTTLIGTFSISTWCCAEDRYLEDGKVTSAQLLVKKKADALLVYCPLDIDDRLYVCYPLKHLYRALSENAYPSFLDKWGIMQPYTAKLSNANMECVDVLFNVGEAELVVSLPSGKIGPTKNVFVGGNAHGFENIISNSLGERSFVIRIDGEEINEDTLFTVRECVSVEAYQETELVQAYTYSDPWTKVTKHWKFIPPIMESQ